MSLSALIPRSQASCRRYAVTCVLALVGFAVAANTGATDEGVSELRALAETWAFAFAAVFVVAYAGLQLATGDATGRAPRQLDERERSLGDTAHRMSYRIALVVATLTVALLMVKAQDAESVSIDSGVAAIAVATLGFVAALPALVLAWLRPGEPDMDSAQAQAERRRDAVLGLAASVLVVVSFLVDLERTVVIVLLVALLMASTVLTAVARRTEL